MMKNQASCLSLKVQYGKKPEDINFPISINQKKAILNNSKVESLVVIYCVFAFAIIQERSIL